MRMRGRVLAIAGSDCGGGAGLQADIKAITCLGGYAATAVTAITVQDTERVHQVHTLPPALVTAQIACVLADPGADAVKTGMLGDADTVAAVGAALAGVRLPIVVDPVMVATSGDVLLAPDGLDALRRLCANATLVTPNMREAAILTGRVVDDLASMRRAGQALLASGWRAVLVKGGHLDTPTRTDLLMTAELAHDFIHPARAGGNTHGTGCTLASAIATGLAQGLELAAAVARAIEYVQAAIASAPGYGSGHGPLNHAVTVAD